MTKVAICNFALARCGISEFIADIDEDTTEAKLCKQFYDTVLDAALVAFDWPFARKRAALDLDSVDPPDEWGYQYLLPPDVLRARFIADALKVRRTDQRIPFKLESSNGATRLLTDYEDPTLVYTYRITDPSKYPVAFSLYLGWALAAMVVFPLTKKQSLEKYISEKASFALGAALSTAYNEEQHPEPPESEFIAARD